MARIKHTKAMEANPRGAQKQLKLMKKLKTRMKAGSAERVPRAREICRKEILTMSHPAQEKYGIKKVVAAKPPAQQQVDDEEKKKRRWRPGTVAKREIRRLSRTTNLLFPKSSFSRYASRTLLLAAAWCMMR